MITRRTEKEIELLRQAGKIVAMTHEHLKPYIKETYINGNSWYRLYSDGWCEQGGQASIPGNNSASVTLLKTFQSLNYNVLVTPQTTSVDNMDGWGCVKESTSSIRIYLGFGTTSTITWKACGFIS